jgi:hypothetical protein
MTTTTEGKAVKIYTTEILHCPMCNRNSTFMYVVKRAADKYYLGTKCKYCTHWDDFKEISYYLAQDYPTPQK